MTGITFSEVLVQGPVPFKSTSFLDILKLIQNHSWRVCLTYAGAAQASNGAARIGES
jgi:hypothetical protein